MLRIFIGWDQREPIAYDVAKFSLEKRASIPVDVPPIKLEDLVERSLYARGRPACLHRVHLFALLHAVARRLQGLGAVLRLRFPVLRRCRRAAAISGRHVKAVYCVQHDYRPKERVKMDGKVQTTYPRKNWSSFMLFNCEHPSTQPVDARR